MQAEDDFRLHDAQGVDYGLERTGMPEATWIRTSCSSMMMPNTIVVAPTTAVPISTGLAVALKVLPAPSPFSS